MFNGLILDLVLGWSAVFLVPSPRPSEVEFFFRGHLVELLFALGVDEEGVALFAEMEGWRLARMKPNVRHFGLVSSKNVRLRAIQAYGLEMALVGLRDLICLVQSPCRCQGRSVAVRAPVS